MLILYFNTVINLIFLIFILFVTLLYSPETSRGAGAQASKGDSLCSIPARGN